MEFGLIFNLLILSHYLISEFNEVEKSAFGNEAVDFLIVLSKNFYVYFSIIYKILDVKICNKNKYPELKSFFDKFKQEFETKIQIIRNEVIIHKEKNNFRETIGSLFDTDFGGLHLKLFTNKKDKKSKDDFFELKPLVDAKTLEDYLNEFKKIVEK